MSELTDKQKSCLRLFMQRLQELLDSRIVKSEKKAIGVVAETLFGENPETTVVFDGYDKEDFVAFFSTLRQFTMPTEEAVYFEDVGKIVLANCDRAELKQWVQHAQTRWNALLDSTPIVKFNLDGEDYTNRKLLKLWLYAGRFHTDIGKADRWDSLPELAQRDAELSIQALTPKLMNCLVIVGSVIRWWRDEPDEAVPMPPAPSGG